MLKLSSINYDVVKHKCQQAARRPEVAKEERNIEDKIVIVTGSNAGIGLETALALATRGAVVILACRDMKKAQEGIDYIHKTAPAAKLDSMTLDLGDLSSVREFVKNFTAKYSRLDILINNGGLVIHKLTRTKDGFETHMGVNHLGHFVLTLLLLDHLKKGAPSRVISVSSFMSQLEPLNLDDLNMEKDTSMGVQGYGAYAKSKLANALFIKELARRLEGKGTGITCYAVCPGMVQTTVTKNLSLVDRVSVNVIGSLVAFTPQEGAETSIYCALSNKLDNESGKMYRFTGEWKEIQKHFDDDTARKLWIKSEQLVGMDDFADKYFN